MGLFKLKTSRLALILAVVTLVLHLGIGYLLAVLLKDMALISIWQRSLIVYWPAINLIQVLMLNASGSFAFGMATMFIAALLELWAIFAAAIWLCRIYFRKPPINNVSKITIGII